MRFPSPSRFFATLDEAKVAAREVAAQLGEMVEVQRVACGDDKASLMNLANGLDWCLSAEVVYSAKTKSKAKE